MYQNGIFIIMEINVAQTPKSMGLWKLYTDIGNNVLK